MLHSKFTYGFCAGYRSSAAHIIAADSTDPLRTEWEIHAANCPACREILKADISLEQLLHTRPAAPPAFIAPAVMNRIRSTQRRTARLFRRSDFGWAIGSSLAGIMIGLFLSTTLPNNSADQTLITPGNSWLAEFDDGIDDMIYTLVEPVNGGQ